MRDKEIRYQTETETVCSREREDCFRELSGRDMEIRDGRRQIERQPAEETHWDLGGVLQEETERRDSGFALPYPTGERTASRKLL